MFPSAAHTGPWRPTTWARWTLTVALLVGGSACDRDRTPSERPRESSPAPVAAPATAEELGAAYSAYWGFFNGRQFDRYQAAFSPKATGRTVDESQLKVRADIVEGARIVAKAFPDCRGEPQLTLVSGSRVISVVRFTGTMDRPLELPNGDGRPATHKKVAFLMGHGLEYDPVSRLATMERSYFDPSALMGQAGLIEFPHRKLMALNDSGPATIVAATGSPDEEHRLTLANDLIAALNRHDADAVAAACTADVVWYDSSLPDDLVGVQIADGLRAVWRAFPDLKMVAGDEFAAGDYVVGLGTITGTNDGDLPSLNLPASHRSILIGYLHVVHFRDGKIDRGWRFVNGLNLLRQLDVMR